MKTLITDHSVDWIHCDPAGIMFYPEFYVWFDQSTERLFAANGLTYEYVRKKYNLAGFPLVQSGAAYKTPCKHGEKVELHSYVEEWANKTFLMNHKIYHKNGVLALEGFERRVWAVADPSVPKGMRAEPVPQEIRDRFVDSNGTGTKLDT